MGASNAKHFLNNGVTAHRGDSARFPENTIAAFQGVLELGVDWIETDAYMTTDGQLVLIHDPTTARVGDASLEVARSSYSELARVDVAHGFRLQNRLDSQRCPRMTVPLLSDALKLIKSQGGTRLSIQPKMFVVNEIAELVRKHDCWDWVGFNDGDLAKMTAAKQAHPQVRVFWDRDANTDVRSDVRIAAERGFEGIVVHHSGVTREKVGVIRGAGLEAGAWTVNDPDEMRRVLDCGVYRIYTDFPERLIGLKRL